MDKTPIARVKAEQALEALIPQQTKPPPVSPLQAEKVSPPSILSVANEQARTGLGGYFGWTLLNILLLVLLANTSLNVVRNVRSRMREPQLARDAAPFWIHLLPVAAEVTTPLSLSNYRLIWERNLFNISNNEAPAPETETVAEKVILAEKVLGLRLVGTVVTDDPRLNRAIIDNLNTREQRIYSEGNNAGKVRIRKVMRNKAILSTLEGDRLLVVDFGGAAGSSDPEAFAQSAVASRIYPQQADGRRPPGRSFQLARKEVKASLSDIGELEQQLNLTAYV